jgi:integrase
MRMKLTDRLAKTLEPGLYWDAHPDAPKGFLLQVTAGNSRAYRLNYRRKGDDRERRLTIGDTSAWPVAEARKRGAELRRQVDTGGDPLGDLEDRRAAPTVVGLIERFTAEALPSRAVTTRSEYRAMFDQWIVPAIGRLKVAAVAREDIERLHRKVTAEGKSRRANAVLSLCSTIFAQAIVWRLREDNPARHVARNPEHGRERYLSGEELDRLMATLERWRVKKPDSVDVIALAVLTGARRGEIFGMAWDQLDLDQAIWLRPAALTKQRKVHRLTLSAEAVAVLRRRQAERGGPVVPLRRAGGLVFPRLNEGNFEFDWNAIRAATGLEDVRFHDLRHSVASWLIAAGMSLPVVGSVLGHSKAQTTQRYAHLSDAAQRQAVDIVGRLVGSGRSTTPGSKR